MIYTNYVNSLTFETGPTILQQIGSASTDHIPHLHILYLLNEQHNMFQLISTNDPYKLFLES